MKARLVAFWIAAIASVTICAARAKPFVPNSDDVVVERLPEQADPSLKEIKRFRVALARDPPRLQAIGGIWLGERAVDVPLFAVLAAERWADASRLVFST